GAFDHYLLVDQHGNLLVALAFVEHFRVRRRAALGGVLRTHRLIDQAEFQFRLRLENAEQAARGAEARPLDQDRVLPLPLDGGLDQAELVDALLDDRNRLLDGLADALVRRRLRRCQPHETAAGLDHVERALARDADQVIGDRLRQLAQLAKSVLIVGSFAQPDLDAVSAHDRRVGPGDAGLAQGLARVVPQRI